MVSKENKMKIEEIMDAVDELNDVLGLEPPIPTETEKEMIDGLTDAVEMLEPEDLITEQTAQILLELNLDFDCKIKEPKKKSFPAKENIKAMPKKENSEKKEKPINNKRIKNEFGWVVGSACSFISLEIKKGISEKEAIKGIMKKFGKSEKISKSKVRTAVRELEQRGFNVDITTKENNDKFYKVN
jgi:hypothetical protein